MADLIRHKRSSAPSAVPAAGDLALGELAINVADGRLFLKKANGDVVDVTSIAGIIGLTEALDGKVNAGDVDFTIIYPNGGSEASPANVAVNSRYVLDNPFPGFAVVCVAEVFLSGDWCETGFFYVSSSVGGGVKATHVGGGSDSIVVQTGVRDIIPVSTVSGSGLGVSTQITAPTPCRVKVWKVKGAIA